MKRPLYNPQPRNRYAPRWIEDVGRLQLYALGAGRDYLVTGYIAGQPVQGKYVRYADAKHAALRLTSVYRHRRAQRRARRITRLNR